jgi:hypothetical protein
MSTSNRAGIAAAFGYGQSRKSAVPTDVTDILRAIYDHAVAYRAIETDPTPRSDGGSFASHSNAISRLAATLRDDHGVSLETLGSVAPFENHADADAFVAAYTDAADAADADADDTDADADADADGPTDTDADAPTDADADAPTA